MTTKCKFNWPAHLPPRWMPPPTARSGAFEMLVPDASNQVAVGIGDIPRLLVGLLGAGFVLAATEN